MPYLLTALAKKEVFWAGYDTARIVHRVYWPYWAVHTAPPVVLEDGRIAGISQESNDDRLVAPRRWVDIYGRRVEEEWEKAKRNVLGWIVARPGMSEVSSFNRSYNRKLTHSACCGIVSATRWTDSRPTRSCDTSSTRAWRLEPRLVTLSSRPWRLRM